MKKYASQFAVLWMLALTVACANLNVPTATTFNEQMALALGAVAAVRATATTLVQAKRITPDDAQNVQTAASTARTGLDLARAMAGTDLVSAGNRLTAIMTGLTALQAYLASKGG